MDVLSSVGENSLSEKVCAIRLSDLSNLLCTCISWHIESVSQHDHLNILPLKCTSFTLNLPTAVYMSSSDSHVTLRARLLTTRTPLDAPYADSDSHLHIC